jgi:virginiamycin A acetyltransferase
MLRNAAAQLASALGYHRLKVYLQKVRRNNHISLSGVSHAALAGDHIAIGQGTQVDSLSSIGSYTYIGRNCTVTRSKIGRYVSIGNNVTIGPGEHDLSRISTSSLFYDNPYDELTKGECILENDAWIGVDVIIMRGVRIGIGAAVAANAVVTKNVPDYAVVAGVPAKILKYRFDEAKQAQINASRWWADELPEARRKLAQLAKEI